MLGPDKIYVITSANISKKSIYYWRLFPVLNLYPTMNDFLNINM